MKKSAVVLCAVLGSLGGVLLLGAVTFGLLFIGISAGGNGYGLMMFAASIMLAVCVPISFLQRWLKRRFNIPAPVFIACTCAAPLIFTVIETAKHLNALAHDGYDYFMGGLAAGLSEVAVRIMISAVAAFIIGQCAAALIFGLKSGHSNKE